MSGQKKNHRLVFLVPIGPSENEAFVRDTLESIRIFSPEDALIVLMDDSHSGWCKRFEGDYAPLKVMATRPHTQKSIFWGRIMVEQVHIMRQLMEEVEFEAVVRMDADALMVGPGLLERIQARLKEHPTCDGLGDFIYTYDGSRRPVHQVRDNLRMQLSLKRWLRYPAATKTFKRLLGEARSTERYADGQLLMGASFIVAKRGVEKMLAHPLPDLDNLIESKMGEDGLFTILMHAAGLTLEDFGRQNEPLCIAHNRMPYAPERVLADKKCIVHSVRGYNDMNEEQVREFFRSRRDWITAEFRSTYEFKGSLDASDRVTLV